MKRHQLVLGSFALVLASCETGPISSTGSGLDPLSAPGSGSAAMAKPRGYTAGTFVTASMDAAFFKDRPRGSGEADKQLPADTSMKVIADDGTYVKVELDSGEVGYVPSVLVSDSSASAAVAPLSGDAYQVYPPLPGASDGPQIDDSIPLIPPVIDPEASVDPSAVADPYGETSELPTTPAIPDAPPIPEMPEVEQEIPPSEPAPLPPGNEAE